MRKRLGEWLVEMGAISQDDLDAAVNDQTNGEANRLGEILLELGRVSPMQLARALAAQYALPYVDLPEPQPAALRLVPADFQRNYRVIPFRVEQGARGPRTFVAVADPSVIAVINQLKAHLKTDLVLHVAPVSDFEAFFRGELKPRPMPSRPPVPPPTKAAAPVADDDEEVLELEALEPGPAIPAPSAGSVLGKVALKRVSQPPSSWRDSPPDAVVTAPVPPPRAVAAVGAAPKVDERTNELELLMALEQMAQGDGEILLTGKFLASLVRVLIRKGVIRSDELVAEVERR